MELSIGKHFFQFLTTFPAPKTHIEQFSFGFLRKNVACEGYLTPMGRHFSSTLWAVVFNGLYLCPGFSSNYFFHGRILRQPRQLIETPFHAATSPSIQRKHTPHLPRVTHLRTPPQEISTHRRSYSVILIYFGRYAAKKPRGQP